MTINPSTPRLRRLSKGQNQVKKTKDGKAIDIGKPLGEYDTASVREKVRKWQTQGGGVVTAEDSLGDVLKMDEKSPQCQDSNSDIDVKDDDGHQCPPLHVDKRKGSSPSPSPRPRSAQKSNKLDEKKKTPAKPYARPRHNDLDFEVKSASAPKKRVVSDSRWRKTQDTPSSKKYGSPQYESSGERPSSRTSAHRPAVSSKATPRVQQRSQSSNRHTKTPEKTNDTAEETKRHSTPHHKISDYPDLSSKRTDRRVSLTGASPGVATDRRGKRTTPSPTRDYVTRRSPKNSSSKRKGRGKAVQEEEKYVMSGALNFASGPEMDLRPDIHTNAELKEGAGPGTASHKLPNQVDTHSKAPGNRIEAWLTSTPDPFTEPIPPSTSFSNQDSKSHAQPIESNISRKSRKQSQSDNVGSHDKSLNSRTGPEQPHGSEDGRRRRISSNRPLNDVGQGSKMSEGRSQETNDDSPSPSPTTLKRRGARRKMQQTNQPRSPVPLDGTKESNDRGDQDAPSTFTSSTAESAEVQEMSMDELLMRRPFPTTGKRLSTIVSVATQNTKAEGKSPSIASKDTQTTERPQRKPVSSTAHKKPDKTSTAPSNKGIKKTSLKRKLTTHADLMSVLSIPREENGSIVSARSIRTSRTRLATATVEDLMKEVASDEAKYMRELRTLVDGVIPVLLSCVLSKAESATAAGLFSRSPSSSGASVTRPIVDMGVALERLKSVHKRIPIDSSDKFLAWTQTALKIYADYIKAWRLGFQDVVVNLAPATDAGKPDVEAWDEGLSRNDDGYLVGGDGERVDVAFLLKRPLVRLKYLAKTVKGIKTLKPSATAERLTSEYQDLVVEARKKSNQEKARMEDEAAAAIDPTRVRDPRSLAALSDVSIHPKRCVRARDYFDLHFPHSSGQLIDCKIEVLLRDNPSSEGEGGDALLCEVSSNEKWLLLPPITLDNISAKLCSGGLTVQIRGVVETSGREWAEVFNLYCDDKEACLEWVEMLGSVPLPPDCSASNKFDTKSSKTTVSLDETISSGYDGTKASSALTESTLPSPRTVEIPIGEQVSKPKVGSAPRPSRNERRRSSPLTSTTARNHAEPPPFVKRKSVQIVEPFPDMASGTKSKDSWWSLPSKIFGAGNGKLDLDSSPTERSKYHDGDRLRKERSGHYSHNSYAQESYSRNANSPSSEGISHPGKLRKARDGDSLSVPANAYGKESTHTRASQSHRPRPSATGKGYSVWLPSGSEKRDEDDKSDEDVDDKTISAQRSPSPPSRPSMARRTSSVPSEDLPSIPRIRKSIAQPLKESSQMPSTPKSRPTRSHEVAPNSAPAALQGRSPPDRMLNQPDSHKTDKPPAPPAHKSPISSYKKSPPSTLKLSPPKVGAKSNRRTSSPLKHEYEPSTATETSSESETSGSQDESESSRSDDSDEDELESDIRKAGALEAKVEPQQAKVSPPESIFSMPNVTISPSQSASQSPYRAVAPQPCQANKTIASIFAWSQKGLWENLHPDECSIVITPGLIEAFEMSAEHSRSAALQAGGDTATSSTVRPLIALELTPLVPIRRGTALDISIRSPPTASSRIRSGNNVMFRSRTSEECSALYHLINNSRINNPTYLALQNARGPYGDPSTSGGVDRRNSMRGMKGGGSNGGGWWASHFGSTSRSYRASTRAPSIQTDSSVGTMATAFSALKRFSGPGRLFNIAHSTVSSRMYSSSSSLEGSSSSGNRTPPNDPKRQSVSTPARNMAATSIANAKIRLYQRESQSKWRDMGAARLAITNPVRPSSSTPAGQSSANGSAGHSGSGSGSSGVASAVVPPAALPRQEKRIIATGKTKGETLLDVTLGESCFERVARTGIAVSVWEETVGPNGEIGQVGAVGGVGARARVYMIQMKTERECAYCYSLLGKLRY